jgi:hypothetical protein
MALFLCLGVSSLVLSAGGILLAFQNAIEAEGTGRANACARDRELGEVAGRLAREWQPGEVALGGAAPFLVRETSPVSPWLLSARSPGGRPPAAYEVLLERGRDGLDLPLAAIAARRLTATGEEQVGGSEPESEPPRIRTLERPSEAILAFADWSRLSEPWQLDPGTMARLTSSPYEAPSRRVVMATGEFASHRLTDLLAVAGLSPEQMSAEDPALVVVSGGDLDARHMGPVAAVLVVNEGELLLEGTQIEGAVFATGTIDLGTTGEVAFSRPVLRWATDRSLQRVRVVPGARREVAATP